ncbi:MAG TPA: hypothetical protein VF339_16220 [Gammaproteobacteria bacterium]
MPNGRDQRMTTADLELRALEKMTAALCRHIELLWRDAAQGRSLGREAELHWQAFEERRKEAMRLAKASGGEPLASRIARLERLVEALEVSREYFKALAAGAQ